MRIKRILQIIYLNIKKTFDYYFGCFKTACFFEKSNDKHVIYLIGTPEHDNLGDHAIAFAEILFIKNFFNDYKIVEITVENFWLYFKNLKTKIRTGDLVFFSGGGNMGDVYYDEKIRLTTIKHIKNPIIVFPQTIYFKNNSIHNKIRGKMIKYYNLHGNNMVLCAREKESYNLMNTLFPKCTVILCPDMVFYLKNYFDFSSLKKENIGICFRDDFEQKYLKEERDAIVSEFLKDNHNNIVTFDTRLFLKGINDNREKHIKKLFSTVASQKLCITDRLHAVIFSILVSTPVLALVSESPKINSTVVTFFEKFVEKKNLNNNLCFYISSNIKFDFSSFYSQLYLTVHEIVNKR